MKGQSPTLRRNKNSTRAGFFACASSGFGCYLAHDRRLSETSKKWGFRSGVLPRSTRSKPAGEGSFSCLHQRLCALHSVSPERREFFALLRVVELEEPLDLGQHVALQVGQRLHASIGM